MKKDIRIGLYIGSWPQNIGNAFFDLGAKAVLQAAVPEATFYPMGGAVHWMFMHSAKQHRVRITNGLENAIQGNPDYANNSMEIGQFADVDIIVFAGMSMCREFVENNGRTFVEASKKGVATLGLGAGAAIYDEDEVTVFSDFLQSLNRSAVITRDDETYDLFSGRVQNMLPGIDCAFFLPDYYNPPRLALPKYDIENFDFEIPDPRINHGGRKVIYTHHDLWGPLPERYICKPSTLVSDVPEDYLTLYSQVTETHADRVHACVASLAYGNSARLYSSTPRKALFSKVGVSNIANELTRLDMGHLKELKQRHIQDTRSIIESLVF